MEMRARSAMSECDEQFPGAKHVHQCWRGGGHYDDHICECGFDWPPGSARSIAEAGQITIEAIQDAVMNNSDGEDIHWNQVAAALGLRAAAGLGKP